MQPSDVHPLVEIWRGKIVESIHFGALAAVDSSGCQLINFGNPQTISFLRSSAKPFQALPFVEAGGMETYALNDRELSVICSSHSGSDAHVEVVSGIQNKIHLGEEHLLCGTHMPYDEATSRQLIRSGQSPTPNRHNCSGKHTGMLAYCQMRQEPIQDYISFEHPMQKHILRTFAEMCAVDPGEVELGIDGCSLPNFGIPLFNAALGYARLADPSSLPEKRAACLQRIFHAMTTFPDMVSGNDHFDTILMQVTQGRIVCKAGAEGYQTLGILPGVLSPESRGVGIAFKIADGDSAGRARPLVSLAILRELGALSAGEIEALARFDERPTYNFRKLQVGKLRACYHN